MPAEQKITRKLRAILSADVKGYSLLMADDEAGTVKRLNAYRDSMSDLIRSHSGRVVDAVGDNLLAEFSSAVDAVQCSVEIQNDLGQKNKDLPENRRLEFRIGINIGDVIQERDRIYGSGVNVAARIESLAEPGGVCISHNAYHHIKEKLGFGYEYLGEQKVKNIKDPVRIYKVLMDPEDAGKLVGAEPKPSAGKWIWPTVVAAAIFLTLIGYHVYQKISAPEFEPASAEDMAYPLPQKPSIAVLPFDNMSGNPKQEFFSDGLTEEIISSLSKTDQLLVIARNSTFVYKDKPVEIKQVAEELGVRYVLEGSVRKSEDRVRVTAQLIDATTGHHLWSERYDRDLKNILALQDEITLKIVSALEIELTEGEGARIWSHKATNLDLLLKRMQARALWRKGTRESYIRHGQLGKEIVDSAPDSPLGYMILAWTNWNRAMAGESPRESIAKAFKLSQKALSLDESISQSHALLGHIYLLMRQYEKAIAQGERAVELNPNGAMAHAQLGSTLCYAGRIDEGISQLKQGIRLNPYPDFWYYFHLGRCYRQKGQYEEALAEYKKSLRTSPNHLFNHVSLAAVYILLNRHEEADAAAKKVLEIDPDFSIKRASAAWPYKPADLKIVVAALRQAGLPYEPPLPLPDKPSIAVLAFDNMSSDPEQEYFGDGIAESIINALSKVGELFVIARNSSFTYKGRPVKVQQISRELGVRYVLEGSVQKSGNRVRITAQLIDAQNGQHLWAENYDRELKDIFEIQDEITRRVVTNLRINLVEGEYARVLARQTNSLDVYLKQIQANSLWNTGTKESLIRYGLVAQEIIDVEPESQLGYRLLSYYHFSLGDQLISPQENYKKAFTLAQKALSLDDSDAFSHAALGYVYLKMRKFDKAIASGMRSIAALDPNNAQAFCLYGSTLIYAEQYDEGISYLKQAIRLNPFPPYYYYRHLGRGYYRKRQYEDALTEFMSAKQRAPESPLPYFNLALTYINLDRKEEARTSASKALDIFPHLSMTFVSKTWGYKTKDGFNETIGAMRLSGFPE